MNIELQPATFLRRYQRFLADVELPNGQIITVHCPNSGSMKTLLEPGSPCLIHDSQNPKRKLRFTLTLLGTPHGNWALVDTQRPNAMVCEAIENGIITELRGYDQLKREVPYGQEKSRIDILLSAPNRPLCYVEVKNNTMLSTTQKKRSDFPDAVTDRGRKHLRELQVMAQTGHRAVLLFIVNRTDVNSSGIAEQIDPAYAKTLREAIRHGVEVLCYRSILTPEKIEISLPCPFDFN